MSKMTPTVYGTKYYLLFSFSVKIQAASYVVTRIPGPMVEDRTTLLI